jgi:hypothetical protein
MWPKIKEFFIKYEHKIILILGFILVAFISFEAGLIKGKEFKEKPIIIENLPANQVSTDKTAGNAPEAQNLSQEGQNNPREENTPPSNCAYLGSKNSNKYHLPTCRWAKQIKPENRVCFSSADEAKSRGYLPDKNCIK